MKFIHTADWHLGKILNNEHLTGEQEKVLNDLLALVDEVDAAAIVIAGDVYDRGVPPVEAVELFNKFVNELVVKRGKKLLYIAGNHDSAERVQFGASVLNMGGVFVRGCLTKDLSPVVLQDEYGPVYFALVPFVTPERVYSVWPDWNVSEDDADDKIDKISCDYSAATNFAVKKAQQEILEAAGISEEKFSELRTVAVAHAFVTGATLAGSERALSVGGTGEVSAEIFAPFTYIALGHLHKPQKIKTDNLRYSGSLLKYSLNEYGQPKAFAIVEIDAEGHVTIEERPIVPSRDIVKIEGKSFDEVIETAQAMDEKSRDAYYWLRLTNQIPVVGAMDRLRKYLPNILQLEWPNMQAASSPTKLSHEMLQASQTDLFASFFSEVSGAPLDEHQQTALINALKDIDETEVD